MELEFLNQLEIVSQEQDEEMFKQPLLFRAQFKSHNDFIVERQALTKEHAQ